ncbi:MAG: citrate lyase subunit alpha [Sphaerochaetaceae bacterium]|jgi:citrate lyase subunit alpha / citrate CoA-transferase|nr:citrate lyase subunit alpha [Sphaerochaetaceae bacterium]NLY07991.1 citrate lyase subunit alpha [Spirochaetales bacterium]
MISEKDYQLLKQHGCKMYLEEENPKLRKKHWLPLLLKEKQQNNITPTLEEAVKKSGLKDGMTISFHHHFRAGDFVVNMVLDVLEKMGFKNLTLAASSLTTCHAPVLNHIRSGLVTKIHTSGMRGELADAISMGVMDQPVTFWSHGARATAIEENRLHIDVAFLGAPSCDPYGNANGYTREGEGKSICGSMGYARIDAQYADHVIVITDNLVPYPNVPFAISQRFVDQVVVVDSIGDPEKIMSGATRFTKKPGDLLIAEKTAEVIVNSGYFYDGFSLQTGSGGASLAVTRFLSDYMREKNIHASFAIGGITGVMTKLHEEGLIKKILDVQSFDLEAANSLKNNHLHQQIDADYYADPFKVGTAVNLLDVVILSALEVDVDFNVNVLTGSDGVIRGAIGGHPDTAAGASLAIVVCPLFRGRIPSVLKHVNTIVTPGSTVDVVVTDQGIAVNPSRTDLIEALEKAHIDIVDIHELQKKAESVTGVPEPIKYGDRIVGIVTYRDGSVIDVIKNVESVTKEEETV